jgi:hypothetical protein
MVGGNAAAHSTFTSFHSFKREAWPRAIGLAGATYLWGAMVDAS